ACAIATNEQILRGRGERAFGYSGSVTPCKSPLKNRMVALAEKVAGLSGCLGSVGVDFVLGEETWMIELNPRFQATLDTVEMATGCSVFTLHLDACRGRLPDHVPEPRQVAARRILFAERDCVARESLAHLAPRVADIPRMGTEIEEGSAVISAFGWGPTRARALEMLDKTITDARKHICRW
ncbi:MAG: ATP-grasp domain-containing protein, partial [Methanomicrobiaceae archaeon]|nr:ATP-grasp domain-containing protein [Methanomicrobiaceae archaeon]